MAEKVHAEVQQSLVRELNLMMRHYFHQSVDEVINELHCQSTCFKYSTEPGEILKTIYQSGILYQRSDKIVSQLRDAVSRFVRGTYGRCSQCNAEIPQSVLMSTPTSDLCPECARTRYSSTLQESNFN
jgi:RNA polymerase-binding transcription factor DksA